MFYRRIRRECHGIPWLDQAFRNNKATLCPPKPKESLSAAVTVISRRLSRDVDQDAVVRVVEVDRRRHDVVADGKHSRDRLDGAGGAQQMPGHGLGGRDNGLVAKQFSDPPGFGGYRRWE